MLPFYLKPERQAQRERVHVCTGRERRDREIQERVVVAREKKVHRAKPAYEKKKYACEYSAGR